MDTPQANKPFWKTKKGIALVAIIAILIIGGIGNAIDGDNNKDKASDKPAATQPAKEENSTTAKEKPTEPDTTSQGLSATPAQVACDDAGKQAFPYGFKAHWITGKLAEKIIDDQWFFKVEADVKNEYNAKQRINFECYVSGTENNPIVNKVNSY